MTLTTKQTHVLEALATLSGLPEATGLTPGEWARALCEVEDAIQREDRLLGRPTPQARSQSVPRHLSLR